MILNLVPLGKAQRGWIPGKEHDDDFSEKEREKRDSKDREKDASRVTNKSLYFSHGLTMPMLDARHYSFFPSIPNKDLIHSA